MERHDECGIARKASTGDVRRPSRRLVKRRLGCKLSVVLADLWFRQTADALKYEWICGKEK